MACHEKASSAACSTRVRAEDGAIASGAKLAGTVEKAIAAFEALDGIDDDDDEEADADDEEEERDAALSLDDDARCAMAVERDGADVDDAAAADAAEADDKSARNHERERMSEFAAEDKDDDDMEDDKAEPGERAIVDEVEDAAAALADGDVKLDKDEDADADEVGVDDATGMDAGEPSAAAAAGV